MEDVVKWTGCKECPTKVDLLIDYALMKDAVESTNRKRVRQPR
jgi:hypothetical protein